MALPHLEERVSGIVSVEVMREYGRSPEPSIKYSPDTVRSRKHSFLLPTSNRSGRKTASLDTKTRCLFSILSLTSTVDGQPGKVCGRGNQGIVVFYNCHGGQFSDFTVLHAADVVNIAHNCSVLFAVVRCYTKTGVLSSLFLVKEPNNMPFRL